MNFLTEQLSDSVKLSTVKTDKFKSGILSFSISTPYTAKNAIYNMILAGILNRGTERYPSLASISRQLDELYASSLDVKSGRLGKNYLLHFTADILDDKYVHDGTDIPLGIVELVSQMLLHPKLENGLFSKAVFEQEKKFLTDNINAAVNNTRAYASVRLSEMMLSGDENDPTLEEMKQIVESTENRELVEYLQSTVCGSPIDIFYVGTLTHNDVSRRILEYFSEWNSTQKCARALPKPEPLCEYCEKTEKMPVSQGKLAMGFKVGVTISENSRDHFTAIVLNELFGGSPASKLFLNVREKLSLCYYCSSSYNQYLGTLAVSSGIDNKNRAMAERAILAELEAIKAGNVSETELSAAKCSLINNYKQFYDNPYDIMEYLANRHFFGFSESIEDAINAVEAVTKEEIIALAGKITCDSVFYVEGCADGEEDTDNEE